MKKKLLSLSLVLVLLLSLFSTVFAAENSVQRFGDVSPSYWAYEYIEELARRGAIGGYPDGNFYPERTVTREEFAKIMVMAAGLTLSPAEQSTYADVSLSHWSSPYIETARPYMTAYQNGGKLFFYPFNGALREDMAVAVVKLRDYDPSQADLSLLTTLFSDLSSISEVTRPYVALAVEHGIINGYDDGTFRGQGTITRAEAAAILYRAFQQAAGDKVIPDDILPTPTPMPSVTPTPAPTPSPEITPSPTLEPSPLPTPEPDTSAAVPAYGYLTGNSYLTMINGKTYVAVSLWNGTENVTCFFKGTSRDMSGFTLGTAIAYTDMGDGTIEDVTILTNITAIAAWDGRDTLKISGNNNEFDLSESAIIYIDSYAVEGVENGNIMIADWVDPFDYGSGYYPNAIAHLSEDGKTLKALFIDVNNRIADASPVFPN